jgi:sugar lactone lactonase YvrE
VLATATFTSADAHGASFKNVEGRQVPFDLSYLYPGNNAVSFTGAVMEGATFSEAVLGQTDFTNVGGASMSFTDSQCINCDFTGAHLEDAHFDGAFIHGAAFKGATLTNASFLNAACCGTGTWVYSLGSGAAAASEPYQPADPTAPTLNGPEFSDVDLCPDARQPGASGGVGCAGETAPVDPPLQPRCSSAASHDCALDIALLAGTGTAGYSPGGSTNDAMLAEFNAPGAVAYDPNTGDALVADTANGVVRRIDQVSSTSPVVSIVAGTPPASWTSAEAQAPLKRTRPAPGASTTTGPTVIAPTGVAATVVGLATNIAIADGKAHTVFTTTGASTPRPLAGTGSACAAPTSACGDGGPASRAQLNAPHGLWYDPTGNLFIADSGDNRIRKVDTSGNITTIAGTGTAGYTGDGATATAAELNGPTDIVGDQLGNLYIADAGNAAIRSIDPTGAINTLAGGTFGGLSNPTALTVDGRNRLYLVDAGANVVDTLNLFGVANAIVGTGTAGYSDDGGPALSAELNGPLGVAAVGDDALFIADTANERIRVVQPS